MSAGPGCWRRLAVRLAQHAAWVLPGAGSAWADAMRRELDHIGDDPAALSWALGCILASYRIRLAGLRRSVTRTCCGRFGAFAAAMLLAGLALQEHAIGQTEPPRPAFAEMACDDLPGISPEVRPRLRCETVSVPRDYGNPGAGRFKLSVVVVRSGQQPVRPDPVVYISGGPGSPLTIYADYQARHPYAPGRDLILVDQRGVGRSEPSLCPDLNGELLDAAIAIAADATEAAKASSRKVYAACRMEAVARGLDLRHFGTTVTVEDFECVRQALGLARWNVVGESYGTTVAMTLVARHPDAVRLAVLDSVYPPDLLIPLGSNKVAEARDTFFASCDRDKACAAEFPDLAGQYRETLDRLDRTPLTMAVPPQMHRPGDRMPLTASLFELLVGRLIYYPTAYPGLPHLIAAVHDRDAADVGAAFTSVVAEAGHLDMAAHAAVECRDRPHDHGPVADGANARVRMPLNGICDGWSELGPSPVIPVGADVPILVLAGEFDPTTGPVLSRHLAELIGTHARWIGFPLIGHNVRHFSSCGAMIVADFIGDPAQPLDASCADQIAPIRFLPRLQAP